VLVTVFRAGGVVFRLAATGCGAVKSSPPPGWRLAPIELLELVMPRKVAMLALDSWNVALLGLAGYLAVMVLVRLMIARRNKLLVELREQAAAEQRRRKLEEQLREQHQSLAA
jgi:hypothetical protein